MHLIPRPGPTIRPVHGLVQAVLDDLVFGRTIDRLYRLILDRSRSPGPRVGPLGDLKRGEARVYH